MKAYRSSIPLALLALFTLAVTPAACGDDAVVGAEPAPMEWFEVSWSGGTIQVALLRPADETAGRTQWFSRYRGVPGLKSWY